MSGGWPAGYMRAVFVLSVWVAAVLFGAAVAVERGFGGAAAGVAVGAAGSFAILGLRARSVSKILHSRGRTEAGRSAFLLSLAKMSVAFAALAAGALFGARGAVGALAGLLTTAMAAVFEGLRVALKKG